MIGAGVNLAVPDVASSIVELVRGACPKVRPLLEGFNCFEKGVLSFGGIEDS